MLDATGWALVGSSLVAGLVSALTMLVPIEVVVVSVAATHPGSTAVAAALAAAIGQTTGKVVILTAVRGTTSVRWLPRRLRRRTDRETARAAGVVLAAADGSDAPAPAPDGEAARPGTPQGGVRGWVQALRRGMSSVTAFGVVWLNGRWGPLVVLCSAVVGLPPLLLMAVAAGISGMPAGRFAAACLGGRSLRFLALVSVPGIAGALT